MAYNLSIVTDGALRGTISPEDYTQASAMIQPFPGFWELPEEGLVIYDWKEERGQVLGNDGIDFEIGGFGHKLFLVSPIEKGWSVIGRNDKYLGPSTVDIVKSSQEELVIRMEEPGSIVLYSGNRSLKSSEFDFKSIGNGFYYGQYVGSGINEITISRQ